MGELTIYHYAGLLILGITVFILSHTITSVFGGQIQQWFKNLLPEGIQTDQGVVTK